MTCFIQEKELYKPHRAGHKKDTINTGKILLIGL